MLDHEELKARDIQNQGPQPLLGLVLVSLLVAAIVFGLFQCNDKTATRDRREDIDHSQPF